MPINLVMLCVRLGNPQLTRFHKTCANLKKIGHPNILVAAIHISVKIRVAQANIQ